MFDFSKPVNDPFIETGRRGFISFAKKEHCESYYEIEEVLKRAIDFYFNKWDRNKLCSIFDHHYIYFKTTEEVSKTKLLNFMCESFTQESENEEKCFICGNRHVVGAGQRTIYPLGFSETNINYLGSFNGFFHLCNRCYLFLFFLPFNIQALQKSGAYLCFVTGENSVMNYWQSKNKKEVNRLYASPTKADKSLILAKESNQENFIFCFLEELGVEDIDVNNDICFYFFNNYCMSPEMEIKVIENEKLKFISPKSFSAELRPSIKKIWNSIVFRSFKYVKAEGGQLVKKIKKGKKESFEEIKFDEAKKIEKNTVIEKFVNDKSLLFDFCKFIKEDIRQCANKEEARLLAKAYWALAVRYLTEVLKMNRERLDFIKSLASRVGELDDGKKILGDIGRCRNPQSLRMILIKAMKKYFDTKKEKLFSVDDFVLKIFPKNENFIETRDILIIAMYEVLADKLVGEDMVLEAIEGDDNE